MQQKQQTIRIIPKAKAKAPPWVNLLIGVSVVLVVSFFILSLVFYFLSNSAKARVEKTDKEINNLETTELKILKVNTLAVSNKIADFKEILGKHLYFSKIFALLREDVHPKVQFLSFDFNAESLEMTINGIAQDLVEAHHFKALGEQILILFFDSRITNLVMTSIELDENGFVRFSLKFLINQDFFRL